MPDDIDALSISSAAVASLLVKEGDELSTDDIPADQMPLDANATPPADEAPSEEEDAPAAKTDAEPPKADAKDASQDDGKKEGEGKDDRGDALPTIEPPNSLTAEEKAGWDALPRPAQEIIARRERDMTKALRTAQDSLADARKSETAEVARLKEITGKLDAVVNDDVAKLSAEFPEIKNPADVTALAATNPARAALFQAKLAELGAKMQATEAAKAEVSKKEEAARTEELAKAKVALVEAFPTWSDPTVAVKEVRELQEYAISQGASKAAAEANLDPIVFKLAQKAMLYDRAQAAKTAAAQKDPPPRVLTPGTSSTTPKADSAAARRAAQWDKYRNSGDLEDAAATLLIR